MNKKINDHFLLVKNNNIYRAEQRRKGWTAMNRKGTVHQKRRELKGPEVGAVQCHVSRHRLTYSLRFRKTWKMTRKWSSTRCGEQIQGWLPNSRPNGQIESGYLTRHLIGRGSRRCLANGCTYALLLRSRSLLEFETQEGNVTQFKVRIRR